MGHSFLVGLPLDEAAAMIVPSNSSSQPCLYFFVAGTQAAQPLA